MHLATVIINDEPITCIVTDRGVAPVAQLDPMLPTGRAELESDNGVAEAGRRRGRGRP